MLFRLSQSPKYVVVGGRRHRILEPIAHSPVVLKWARSLEDIHSFGVADKARGKAILSKVPAVVT